MVNIIRSLLLLVVFISFKAPNSLKQELKNEFALKGVEQWFAAWELVCKEVYKIDTLKPVEFVFFDDRYIYSTSVVSIAEGELIDGPELFKKKLDWKRALHNGKITLPDKQVVPVGLMSFASALENGNKNSFFVMPLPEFWKTAGVQSKELGLDNLVTGVFLHEFSHTQQMQNFGKKMSEYEQLYKFETAFSDDIIQDYFEKDSAYNAGFRNETALFYAAAINKNKAKLKALTKQAIEKLILRQKKYFTAGKTHFKEIDDFFLTMEGLGQFTMYAWLIHPKGGNIPADIALKGVRRGGRSWSQEEGLALFLILEKLSKPERWCKLMFGNKTESVIKLIAEKIK